jgi:hypothetical protein
MIRRLFWNAKWNETLYLVSCAERLVENPTQHSVDQFFNRLTANLSQEEKTGIVKFIKFRLVFIGRQGSDLVEQICYESPVKLIEQLDSL